MMAQWLVIGVLAVVLIAQGGYTLVLRRRLRAVEQRQARQAEKMRQELTALNSAAVGVGQRLISAEQTLREAVARREPELASSDDREPLERAVHSAAQGMTATQLVEQYGLSEAEASLLSLLKTHTGDDQPETQGSMDRRAPVA